MIIRKYKEFVTEDGETTQDSDTNSTSDAARMEYSIETAEGYYRLTLPAEGKIYSDLVFTAKPKTMIISTGVDMQLMIDNCSFEENDEPVKQWLWNRISSYKYRKLRSEKTNQNNGAN
jgi:hypothetical protein